MIRTVYSFNDDLKQQINYRSDLSDSLSHSFTSQLLIEEIDKYLNHYGQEIQFIIPVTRNVVIQDMNQNTHVNFQINIEIENIMVYAKDSKLIENIKTL